MIDTKELRKMVNAAQLESFANSIINSLLDRLEAAESDAAHQKALAESALRVAEGWERKCDELLAMLMAALDVLEEVKGNINPERGYADELEADVERAIAIALPGAKGE